MDRRKKQEALVREIQSRITSYEVKNVLELLSLMLETSKNNLLTCSNDEFSKLQGEAQAYDKLIRTLTRPSIGSALQKE